MDTIITTDEIKTILGITGTSQDQIIGLWNQACTVSLANILGIRDFSEHIVSDEKLKIFDRGNIIVNDFPVNFSETITVKDSSKAEITGLTFEQENNYLRSIRILDSSGAPTELGFLSDPYNNRLPEVYVSYTAGYTSDTMPSDLKNIIALMVGGGIAEQTKAGGIAELKIDDKTVKFRSNSDGNGGESSIGKVLLDQWSPYYANTLNILAA